MGRSLNKLKAQVRRLDESDLELALGLSKAWNLAKAGGETLTKALPTADQMAAFLGNKDFHVFMAFNVQAVLGGLIAHTIPLITRNENKMLL